MDTDLASPGARVRRALEAIDATIIRVDDKRGEVDFTLDGMDGFARERRGLFRASFFVEYDPDPVEAQTWVSANPDLAHAEAQHIELADGAALRVLVELPFDEQEQIWVASQTAHALRSAWKMRNDSQPDLLTTLSSAGIALPPLGNVTINEVHTYGRWSWGTSYVPSSTLYMFEAEVIARRLIDHGPTFAMAHAGHGINSYGLNLVTTSPSGAIAAYVQHGYGGAYANAVTDVMDINSTYSRLSVLWQATETSPCGHLRWLLLYSQFRGTCGVLDLDQMRQGQSFKSAFEQLGFESTMFQTIADRSELRDINPARRQPDVVIDEAADVHLALGSLIKAFSATDVNADGEWVEFLADELYVLANIVEVSKRVRVRVYLDTDEREVVQDWVRTQPTPYSGLIEAACIDEPDWQPRLVFERPLADHDWTTDPLFDDIKRYRDAWLGDLSLRNTSIQRTPYIIAGDPRDRPPASAWLLKGDEAAFPSRAELEDDREAADAGIFTWEWTTAPQTQIGDLVIIYFVAPRKAVHFVARAASNAFFSREISVNADRAVNRAQWWAYFTTPIEIDAISAETLRHAAGGYLPLKGRSGLYLRPEAIGSLPIRAKRAKDRAELERVVRVPVGRAELPNPKDITHSVWKDLSAGALPLEAHVSSYIVEPLLRDLLEGTGLTWEREYRVGRRLADFVVRRGNTPVHVIEVKKVIKAAPDGRWSDSSDFMQLRWYADQLGVAGTLIDSHRVLLVDPGGMQPRREIMRRSTTRADLSAIREHLLAH